MDEALPKVKLIKVWVNTSSEKEILEFIVRGPKNGGEKIFIVTINPEIIVFANKDQGFKSIINSANLGLADGIGVVWAGKILGKKVRERTTGVDLMKKLCKRAAKEGLTVGFLGGRDNVALKTAKCLQQKYPNLQIAFAISGNPDEATAQIVREKILRYYDIKKKSPSIPISQYPSIDLLFVAFGFPKQEFWIAENLKNIPVRMAMGVGGAFDYISGRVPRSPKWIRAFGFEWLFRLIVQPWRWKRQLALIQFMFLIFKELFAKEKSRVHN